MQQQEQQQSPSFLQNVKGFFNLASTLVLIVSLPTVLVSRKFGTWGERYLKGPFLLGLFWPVVFVGFWPPNTPGMVCLLWFWQAQFVLLLLHLGIGATRRRKGYKCHSMFRGLYLLETAETPLRKAETQHFLVTLILGVACCTFSPPLGSMIIIGLLADMCVMAMVEKATQAKLRGMEDARLEQEYLMGEYQQRNRNQR